MSNRHLETLEKELKKINQTVLVKIPLSEYNSKEKIDIPASIWEEVINFEKFISQREQESPYKTIQYEQLVDPYADIEILSQPTAEPRNYEVLDRDESVAFFEDYD